MNAMDRADYAKQDVGNVVSLEHVNLRVPDQRLATAFYVTGLGLTRDPYMMTGVGNMWINIGRSQLHLPTGKAQRLRGRVALIVGEREALVARLSTVRSTLDGTAFGWTEHEDRVEVTCPWGNRYDCLLPDARDANAPWADLDLGIAYVRLDVPPGRASAIAAFYRQALDASASVHEVDGAQQAVIATGPRQQLVFVESNVMHGEYDGHHIQIYVSNFSKPHAWLAKRGLAYDEEPYQYRFSDIVDNETGETCFQLEHEVRSTHHPLYARALVNRNPEQNNQNYQAGGDARTGLF